MVGSVRGSHPKLWFPVEWRRIDNTKKSDSYYNYHSWFCHTYLFEWENYYKLVKMRLHEPAVFIRMSNELLIPTFSVFDYDKFQQISENSMFLHP